MILQDIEKMIKQTLEKCKSWVVTGEDDLLRFVDPIDEIEISAHYGATHAAAAFIIYGEEYHDNELAQKGYELLDSVLKRWELCTQLPSYHNDFNNFALCVIWSYIHKIPGTTMYCERIKKTILNSKDSNNPTVNWFPMRWYVNFIKYQWSGDEKYNYLCNKCSEDIKKATFRDGFIDDRLPVGLSFNLQYDVATVAVLQFLRSEGVEIDLSLELGALLNAVSPDGDINYLGRGTNQIFAWGLWIYLLSSSGKTSHLQGALRYLQNSITAMLDNNNMMLNEWDGKEKYMWWDYHYCSVYTAHFLFWLVLAYKQFGVAPICENLKEPGESGIRIYRDRDYFIATFAGRKEYLAEKGPCIAAIWTKKTGMLTKGTFGPWQGVFGNRYSPEDSTIRNYVGLYRGKQNIDLSQNRFTKKFASLLQVKISELVAPVFTEIYIKKEDNNIQITWNMKNKNRIFLNFPVMNDNIKILFYANGEEQRLYKNYKIRNQYTWVHVIQSKMIVCNKCTLVINI